VASENAYIELIPGRCGDRPRIAGTRVRVQDVYVWHELQGQSPDQIVADYPQLQLAQVYAALAYYHDHRDLIRAEVELERREAEAASRARTALTLPPLVGSGGDAAMIST
jgi:uncharacterized protein (DUF433 family)